MCADARACDRNRIRITFPILDMSARVYEHSLTFCGPQIRASCVFLMICNVWLSRDNYDAHCLSFLPSYYLSFTLSVSLSLSSSLYLPPSFSLSLHPSFSYSIVLLFLGLSPLRVCWRIHAQLKRRRAIRPRGMSKHRIRPKRCAEMHECTQRLCDTRGSACSSCDTIV